MAGFADGTGEPYTRLGNLSSSLRDATERLECCCAVPVLVQGRLCRDVGI
jgi:hypothetical protein